MLIKIQGFLYQNHSWSIVQWNLARSFIKMGHVVHLHPTDKNKKCHLPDDLKLYEKNKLLENYDLQISYTAPINWCHYLKHGKKNRFPIWNYEYRGAGILPGFAKYHLCTDKVLPSSGFTKKVFLDMGIPEEKMVVIPHGINLEEFSTEKKWPLKTKNKRKILLNIAQPHKRKALHLALEAFGRAFSSKDDICLVAKISISNKTDHQFSVDFYQLLSRFKRKYKNHANIEVITEFIPNIAELYNSCDINFSATFTECWHLPSIEALATGLVNVVPKYGGLLHFCNDKNSVLIDGDIVRAPRDHLYWRGSSHAQHFKINVENAAEKLRYVHDNYDGVKEKMLPYMKQTVEIFSWDSAARQIIGICK